MSFDPTAAKSLFLQAAELPTPAERMEFLDRVCSGNTELRVRVEALLESHNDPGSFLNRPAVDLRGTREVAEVSTDGEVDPIAEKDPTRLVAPKQRPAVSLDFLTPCDTPERLGKLGVYEIIEVIGRGGMGVVLRAMDPKLNRVVAIKVLAPELAANPMARIRFFREARAAAAVRDDHVVTIHAVEGEDHNQHQTPFLVMECIVGQSLQEKIDRVGALGLKEILRIGMQIASGLAAAHKQGLVHRDIKPANILLENGIERVKITDFGLARAVDDIAVTQSDMISGTPQYMSPEQAQSQSVDHRSDLFSLGSVLYTMSTGRPAFRAKNAMAVMFRVCQDTPRPVLELNPNLPGWLVEIVSKLMSKNAADRYQTAAEVVEVLSQHLTRLQEPRIEPHEHSEPTISHSPAQHVRSTDSAKTPLVIENFRSSRFARWWWLALLPALLLWIGRQRPTEAIKNANQVGDPPQANLKSAQPTPHPPSHRITSTSTDNVQSTPLVAVPIKPANVELPPVQGSEGVRVVLGEGHGRWRIKEGELWCAEHSSDTEDWLFFGHPEWTDYDFTVRASSDHPLTGHGPGVFFRSLPRRRATLAALNVFKSSQDYFDEIDGASWRSPWNDGAMPRHVGREVRNWSGMGHEIKVSVRGHSAKVFVDGVETLAYDKLKQAQGYVGVRSHKDWPSRFRNPLVTAPDGKVLLDGWPALPPGIGVIEAEVTRRFAVWAVSRGGNVILPGGKPIESLTDGVIPHIVRFEMDPAVAKPLTDADLAAFQDLPGVENSLGFRFQNLTPNGLIKLGALMQGKRISHLGLVDMPMGVSAFREPGGFESITGGTFQNIDAKDEELIHLRNLKSLDQLNLRFNKAITDAGLIHLAEMKTLKHLHLEGTGVTATGVAKLQATLPDCEVTTSVQQANFNPQSPLKGM